MNLIAEYMEGKSRFFGEKIFLVTIHRSRAKFRPENIIVEQWSTSTTSYKKDKFNYTTTNEMEKLYDSMTIPFYGDFFWQNGRFYSWFLH